MVKCIENGKKEHKELYPKSKNKKETDANAKDNV